MMKKAGFVSSVVSDLRTQLETKGNAETGSRVQKYLHSKMPCCGVNPSDRRVIAHNIFSDTFLTNGHELTLSAPEWQQAVCDVWDAAHYREERNVAIDLLCWQPCHQYLQKSALPVVEKIVVEGAWWDLVDSAACALGNILRSDPDGVKQELLFWSVDQNVWKRRAAIISQINFRDETDFAFLQSCINPNLNHNNLSVRKGIGRALRKYACHNPFAVQAYVELNDIKMASVSRKEALKHFDASRPGRLD